MEKTQEKSNKIENAIREAIFDAKIFDDRDGTWGFKPSASSKYKKLLYKKLEPLIPDIQISKIKEHQQELIASDENPKERETITTSFSQSANGVVIIKESKSETIMKWGSGVLIGPDLVLTAAQNVYDNQKPTRKKYPYIKFIPGANGDEAPFGEIEVEEAFASEKYINNQGDEENFALMILKTPIGRETGCCGVRAIPAEHLDELKDSIIYVMGGISCYAGDERRK